MAENHIDHDRLFRELITTFFAEFMELFFPEVHQQLDYSHLKFLAQEIFTDVTAGQKNVVDIVVETRLQGAEGHILIHVESHSSSLLAIPAPPAFIGGGPEP